jgi:hypothetical protein
MRRSMSAVVIAWVLWQHSVGVGVNEAKIAKWAREMGFALEVARTEVMAAAAQHDKWQPLKSFATLDECALGQRAAELTGFSGQKETDAGAVVSISSVCLPESVNPMVPSR